MDHPIPTPWAHLSDPFLTTHITHSHTSNPKGLPPMDNQEPKPKFEYGELVRCNSPFNSMKAIYVSPNPLKPDRHIVLNETGFLYDSQVKLEWLGKITRPLEVGDVVQSYMIALDDNYRHKNVRDVVVGFHSGQALFKSFSGRILGMVDCIRVGETEIAPMPENIG